MAAFGTSRPFTVRQRRGRSRKILRTCRYASGASQSAGRLQIYFNSVRPLDPIYDALLLIVGGGMTRTDQGIKVFGLRAFEIVNLSAVSRPAAGRGAVKSKCAANSTVCAAVSSTVSACLDNGCGPGTGNGDGGYLPCQSVQPESATP